MASETLREIELLLRARSPLLFIEAAEEGRVRDIVRRAALTVGVPYHRWTLGSGLVVAGGSPLYDTKDPAAALRAIAGWPEDAVFHLEDLGPSLEAPAIRRAVKDVVHERGSKRRTLVITGTSLTIPADLAPLGARVPWSLPDDVELERVIARVVNDLSRTMHVQVRLPPQDQRELIRRLRGLTVHEAERAVGRAVADDLALTSEDLETVTIVKREVLEAGGALELVTLDPDAPPRAAGLGRLWTWVDRRKNAFGEEARAFGLTTPRGILLLGVQGCGKSLAARVVAWKLRFPLLRLEAGRLFDKYIGESEKRLDRALAAVERMAPCVLWIDEIEKALASGGDGHADGGLSTRLVGRLLTWLQERKAPVFVVATCNDPRALPPELMRKGRFDEVFFVDLPSEADRAAIFALHLQRRGRDPATFDLVRAARAASGFSGAEVEQAVVGALHRAFATGLDVATDDLVAEIEETRPLSLLRREEVQALRAWARERAVPAGEGE
ncbi:MAG: AAA family ATPase [Planctomycetota bacterium]